MGGKEFCEGEGRGMWGGCAPPLPLFCTNTVLLEAVERERGRGREGRWQEERGDDTRSIAYHVSCFN